MQNETKEPEPDGKHHKNKNHQTFHIHQQTLNKSGKTTSHTEHHGGWSRIKAETLIFDDFWIFLATFTKRICEGKTRVWYEADWIRLTNSWGKSLDLPWLLKKKGWDPWIPISIQHLKFRKNMRLTWRIGLKQHGKAAGQQLDIRKNFELLNTTTRTTWIAPTIPNPKNINKESRRWIPWSLQPIIRAGAIEQFLRSGMNLPYKVIPPVISTIHQSHTKIHQNLGDNWPNPVAHLNTGLVILWQC